MQPIDLLRALEISQSDFQDIPGAILKRMKLMGASEPCIAFSCLHNPQEYVVYSLERRWVAQGMPFDSCEDGAVNIVTIQHPELRELSIISPEIIIKFDGDGPETPEPKILELFVADVLARIIHRYRSLIRRLFIEAKVGSDDIGTFCFRLLNEYLPSVVGPYEAKSIFVLDKSSKQIRLRSQYPKRDDRRHLTDVSISSESRSWLAKAYNTGRAIAEYDDTGMLTSGRTREADSIRYQSRLYWPIQLQHKRNWTGRQRTKDPVIGVLRLSNPYDRNFEGVRPFHSIDAFIVEFVCESLYNIIGSFIDRAVEGFDRDLAFHAAKTPAAGCLRNIQLAAQLLFHPNDVPFLEQKEGAVPKQFDVFPTGVFDKDDLIRALNNAYAFALNIAAQVDRANITEELVTTRPRVIEKLYADVIQKAVSLLPYFQVSHSISHDLDGQKRLQINRLFDGPLPPPVVGDPGSLTSVFNNVLENSVKYSKRDCPTILTLTWEENDTHVVVSVKDNGIGIPPEDATRIFTRGTRSERSKEHTVRGSGLGLAYCQRVMRSFGGDVEAVPLEDGLIVRIKLQKAATPGGR